MLSLELRLVNQYIRFLFIRILFIIDLVCCFHVSCVSKWSPGYLTCLVCVMYMPFNWTFGGFRFLNVNVIWLHLLGFYFFILQTFFYFFWCCFIFLTAVSGLVCLTNIAVSSANVSILLLVVVGTSAVNNMYNIGQPICIMALLKETFEDICGVQLIGLYDRARSVVGDNRVIIRTWW